MPKVKRTNIGRRSRNTSVVYNRRANQTNEERLTQNEMQQVQNRGRNASEDQNLNDPALRRVERLSRNDIHIMEGAAFTYNPEHDYSQYGCIGALNLRCLHCAAFKLSNETAGMCCNNGKVRLPAIESPTNPLRSFILGTSPISKHFLSHIREYNAAFQMTSFGATNVVRESFMPTFKIQGQIYHRAGSLLPFPDADHQFMQIYFISDDNHQLDRRCSISPNTRREIVSELQTFLHQNNVLVQLFKTALDRMPSDNHKIVIRADNTPFGEHARRFNAPTIDEVAIVIVGDQFQSRDMLCYYIITILINISNKENYIHLKRNSFELQEKKKTLNKYRMGGYEALYTQ